MATKTEIGWAIVSADHDIYIGWHRLRREMIAHHLADLYGLSRFTLNGKLSETQTHFWKKRLAKGDRAVKVRITYQA